jgi:hypothetical protein
MALGSSQPLTEMSTRNVPGGEGRPARKADNHLWADYLDKIWEPRRLTTLCAFTTCYRDSFFFTSRYIHKGALTRTESGSRVRLGELDSGAGLGYISPHTHERTPNFARTFQYPDEPLLLLFRTRRGSFLKDARILSTFLLTKHKSASGIFSLVNCTSKSQASSRFALFE